MPLKNPKEISLPVPPASKEACITILMVEDSLIHVRLIQEMLKRSVDASFFLEHVDCLAAGLEYLARKKTDLVLVDLSLPDAKDSEIVQKIHGQAPAAPMIILTGKDDEQLAIELVRQGAQDYLVKGRVDHHALIRSIRYAMERQRLLAELETHRASFRNIVDKTTDGVVIIDLSNRVRFINPAAEILFGKKSGYMLGKAFEFSIKEGHTMEISLKRDGQSHVLDMCAAETEWEGETAWLASLRDITKRKEAEDQVRTSLKEKVVLLKEIHHRVKNNLQIISSLLRLQMGAIKDLKDIEVFKESQNKIKAMALIHEILYQSENIAKINFADYLRRLGSSLFRSYGVNPNMISLEITANNMLLSLDAAIPCGLIVNELVSNSIKHAFRDRKKGRIWIDFFPDASQTVMTMIVGDDGKNFPKEFAIQNTRSLGLRLVNTLVDQLRGTVEVQHAVGTAFKIVFPSLGG